MHVEIEGLGDFVGHSVLSFLYIDYTTRGRVDQGLSCQENVREFCILRSVLLRGARYLLWNG